MSPIPLKRPELAERLQQVAIEEGVPIEALLEQAVVEFLERVTLVKLKDETSAFEQLHPQLVKEYYGQHVAIYQGALVDHDPDLATLRRRIRSKFGQTPVLLRQVTKEAKLPDLVIHSFRLVR
jgi:hypothetical protein